MYSFSTINDKFYVHIVCSCGRQFKAEEMYICYNCNIVICGNCLTEEIEYCYCKNYCKRNQCVPINQAKGIKNSCDQCLECPTCKIALIKKVIDGKYVYGCNYCSWDTSNIKFVSKDENDIEGLIYQLKESNIKGYLKKAYDLTLNKLKGNDVINKKIMYKRNSTISKYYDDDDDYERASSTKVWDLEQLEESVERKIDINNKIHNMDYVDNYITEHKSNFAFQAVANFLHVNLDYMDKGLNKVENLDSLKEKLKYDYDVGLLASMDQRIGNLVSQHPTTHVYFPQFVKLITKKSKRCKNCKKYIVQSEDFAKKTSQKYELCHLFIGQLPYCYINKVDLSGNYVLLKFTIFDFKEAKIQFKDSDSFKRVKVNLPKGNYELSEFYSEDDGTDKKPDEDEFLISKSERTVLLKFTWTFEEEEKQKDDFNPNLVILRFIISVEYTRLETKNIEYELEVKLS